MTNASALIDAIAEPTRRAIVERLVDGPAAVSDLAREMPITRSAVSQHLQILKSVGLVSDPDALAVIRAYFDAFWTRSLTAFRDAAEQHQEDA
jgi:DNA-binding transcriptional ArsR family regulator